MNREASRKLLEIQEAAMEDDVYRMLMDEYTVRNKQFLHVMQSLPEEQQAAIYDYFGVVIEIHMRLLTLLADDCIAVQ